jgi:hypothetical protein
MSRNASSTLFPIMRGMRLATPQLTVESAINKRALE